MPEGKLPEGSSVLFFFYASGIVAHTVPALRVVAFSLTDLFLFGINLFLLRDLFVRWRDWRLLGWIVPVYGLTFALEAAGVATGEIFGQYHYGSNMHLKLWGVPLVIALNWLVLALAVNSLAMRFFSSSLWISLFSGLLIAGYDFFIEPVAIRLDYWQWERGEIPLQNYVAWGIIGTCISWPLHYFRLRFETSLLIVYLAVQWCYFNALVLLDIRN